MQDMDLLSIYLAELEGIEPLSAAEEETLLEQLKSGVVTARDRLAEGNLHFVLECVTDYESFGSSVSDLVQEGNVALLSAIDAAAADASVVSGERFKRELERQIRAAIEAHLKEEEVADAAAIRFTREANQLFETTREFEEREGRAATLEELVHETGLTADEIEYIIRVSQSAIERGDANPKEEEAESFDDGGDPLTDGWK